MTTDTGAGEPTTLTPEESFAVLGNHARLQILETLGRTDDPVAFSDLFERVDYDDSSNFDYHLGKLVGHFVRKTERGYVLRPAGERVVEAVLSGAVSEDPVIEPTSVEKPCRYCSEPIRVAYQHERVELHCPSCSGMGSGGYKDPERDRFDGHGNLGYLILPPGGVRGRTPAEVIRAAEVWTATEIGTLARGICPRCSATVRHETSVCADHDVTDGRCEHCRRRFGAMVTATCTNCILTGRAPLLPFLAARPELMGFLIDHDIDPVSPEAFESLHSGVDETIRSTDPVEVHVRVSLDGESVAFTVGEELSVVDVTRRSGADG